MAEEPAIIGREAAAREFPSDLPEQQPKYPGKPLAHRFTPTDKPRLVEEDLSTGGAKLAGGPPFKPVAAFNYPDKNVYLGPVSNVRTRGIQPIALEGRVSLPNTQGEPLEVSEELRRPLEARINRLATYSQKAALPEQPVAQEEPVAEAAPQLAAPSPNAAILTDLEKIKAAAIEELARREATSLPQKPLASPLPELLPSSEEEAPKEETVILPKLAREVTSPTPTPTIELEEELGNPEDKTKKLLTEAERLETELTETLKQLTSEKQELRTTVDKREKESEYLGQISELVADRTRLLEKTNDLSASLKLEQNKRVAAETKLAEETQGFDRQIQQLRIEKTNLLDQMKTLEEKVGELDKKQAMVQEVSSQILGAKNELSVMETARNEALGRAKKLEALLTEIQKAAVEKEPEKIITRPPTREEPKEAKPAARVVRPQVAIGKMAPTLTSTPNVINGIVKDATGYLLPNVIIVVKDPGGEPVRALKTNKIGQFAISTPLPNGTYTIELEAEGRTFDIVEVDLEGRLLPPLEVRANN
jgi:hypothetical protein